MNGRLGRDMFNSLRVLLYYRSIYTIIIGKHTQKLQNKMTKSVYWSTQGGGLKNNYTSKVETVLSELDVK